MPKLIVTEIATLSCATAIAIYLLWRNRQNPAYPNLTWFVATIGIAFGLISLEKSSAQTATLCASCGIGIIALSYSIASIKADLIPKLATIASYFGFIFFIHLSLSGHKIKDKLPTIFSNKLLTIPLAISFFALFIIFAKQCVWNNVLLSTAFFLPFRFPALLAIVYSIKWVIYQFSKENTVTKPHFSITEHFPGTVTECLISASQWVMIVCLQLRESFSKLKDLSVEILAAVIDYLHKLYPASEYWKNLAADNPLSKTLLLDKSKIFLPALSNIFISVCLWQCLKKFASIESSDHSEEKLITPGEIVLLILTSISIGSEILVNNL